MGFGPVSGFSWGFGFRSCGYLVPGGPKLKCPLAKILAVCLFGLALFPRMPPHMVPLTSSLDTKSLNPPLGTLLDTHLETLKPKP